ncbi:hypothetical protein H6F86_11240 [Phormidium sp. FACHB-592]|uniref:Uncharacterized protein n=1 Tax=Stenomitos frigidus AS-A4 TaxID=2933935 RepID=A0ABV0KJ85_9CYAN|nr:hypothetical protein [Phormidium sp. FACHB-592]MBD2074448.1 hypothetical protein [Phormidium sp. FACHB-592]
MNQSTRTHRLPAFVSSDRAALALRFIISCFGMATVFISHSASAETLSRKSALQLTKTPVTMPVATIPVAKKLLGQWLTKEPLEGDTVMFVFAPEGKLYILSGTSASGNAIANQVQYRLDDKPQPMHLDVILAAETTVETLFEFTADGDLRVQMLDTRPGKLRPKELNDNATLFQKISDDTTPPPGSELKKSSAK